MNAGRMDNRPLHSIVGPSAIGDIILCPGRVKMSKRVKDQTSLPAAEGTVAHECGELVLTGKNPPKIGTIINQDGHDIEVTAEMLAAVDMYVKHIQKIEDSQPDDANYTRGVEVKGRLDWLGIPEVWGTIDYVCSVDFRTLYIRDYKHGRGVEVEADNNAQMMTYALCAAGHDLETFDSISLGIVQPRAPSGNHIKIWETTPEYLLQWAENVLKPAVKLAMGDSAPLNPGEKQCMWCRGKAICPALAKESLRSAQADFQGYAEFEVDSPSKLTMTNVEALYPKLKMISGWIKAIEQRVFDEMATGGKVQGYKLVKGRRSRIWANEQEALKVLKFYEVDPYDTLKLLSPAKAEKALGANKKEVKDLIETKDGKPTIVKDSDKRTAINTLKSAQEDFKNVKN